MVSDCVSEVKMLGVLLLKWKLEELELKRLSPGGRSRRVSSRVGLELEEVVVLAKVEMGETKGCQ